MIKKIILFLALIIIFGCKQEDSLNSYIDFNQNFPTVKSLKGIPQKKLKQLSPFRLFIFDSLLIINDWDENPRFHFYNKNTLEKITDYGTVGNGPGEFETPEFGSQLFKNTNGDKSFLIYELGAGLVYEANLSNILDKDSLNDNAIIMSRKFLPPNLVGSDHILKVNGNLVGEALPEKEIKYFRADFETFSPIEALGEVYKSDYLNTVEPRNKSFVDRSYLVYSKKHNLFVSAYKLLNKIQVMDSDFNVIRQINYGKEKTPKSREPFDMLNINYFTFPFAGEDKFYVMYNGRSSEGREERYGSEEIHVFDYKGNPIAKYQIDKKILSFTIDEETNSLYVITEDENTPIFKYDLNE